jgi:hypothetical protein
MVCTGGGRCGIGGCRCRCARCVAARARMRWRRCTLRACRAAVQGHLGPAPCPLTHPPAVVKDEAHAVEDENQELWTADWDDEEVGEDFQQRLQKELGRHMKE